MTQSNKQDGLKEFWQEGGRRLYAAYISMATGISLAHAYNSYAKDADCSSWAQRFQIMYEEVQDNFVECIENAKRPEGK